MTIEDLEQAMAALKDAVPTKEQLLTTANFPVWNGGATQLTTANRITLLVAPFPLQVLSVGMSMEYGTVPASDGSYWSGVLEGGDGAAGFPDIATKTTQINGANAGGAIMPRAGWFWDSANWSAENAVLGRGELLAVNWTPVGSPAALRFPQSYVIRVFPL